MLFFYQALFYYNVLLKYNILCYDEFDEIKKYRNKLYESLFIKVNKYDRIWRWAIMFIKKARIRLIIFVAVFFRLTRRKSYLHIYTHIYDTIISYNVLSYKTGRVLLRSAPLYVYILIITILITDNSVCYLKTL